MTIDRPLPVASGRSPAIDPRVSAPIRVLYIHPAGSFGGASRSLLELIRGFPPGTVAGELLLPHGNASSMFDGTGIRCTRVRGISQFDNTIFGHYRGVRWLILARELAYLPFTLWAILSLRRRADEFDLVHVNEVTALPALLLARRFLRRPAVIHVRSVQWSRPTRRSRLLHRILRQHAAGAIAIDETVRMSLPADLDIEIVRNSFTPAASAADSLTIPERRGPDTLRVGIVGGLLLEKGVMEFLEAIRLCRQRGMDVEGLIAGESPRVFSPLKRWVLERLRLRYDVGRIIRGFIQAHGLEKYVHELGFVKNVSVVYDRIDVLCFPCHVEALGRPVFEAAYYGKPSIFTLQDLRTIGAPRIGIAVRPRDAAGLAEAIATFYEDRGLVSRLGAEARRWAHDAFNRETNALRVLNLYRRILKRESEERL